MIERTFVHLPGIGVSTEKKLLGRGLRSWSELKDEAPRWFRGSRLEQIQQGLKASQRAWDDQDLFFFYENLPRTEVWRFIPGFFDRIAFLDIETNGLALPPVSRSTTITFFYRGQIFQEHEHERKARLVEKMEKEAAVFCSYFGEVFDLPFLRREFQRPLRKPHVDLCFWLRRLGYNGGLKKIQRCFNDIPARQSLDISGLDAVRLWKLHERGVAGALETLLAYNAEDTLVLEPLLIKAFNMEILTRPHLGLSRLDDGRSPPAPPTSVDASVYRELKRLALRSLSL